MILELKNFKNIKYSIEKCTRPDAYVPTYVQQDKCTYHMAQDRAVKGLVLYLSNKRIPFADQNDKHNRNTPMIFRQTLLNANFRTEQALSNIKY